MYRIRWPEVVSQAREIVASYEFGVTLRALYYVLFTRGVIPHRDPVYRRLSARLAEARRCGEFPPLIDNVRQGVDRRGEGHRPPHDHAVD
ncbi:hypothetical protein GCM10012275_63920 [Longimycelium tulufanense]|uniref:Uncharacterized protein n=1 Tax=Longimycelium tulufanense TaxID=907463 RepID=A0A8J3CF61_9PSEU|nr:hypothetical protein [Longimycelium tulufanense]GGM84443.1 hypothetical protein GCM10012275_63920 [Longimycelium tulufanense]